VTITATLTKSDGNPAQFGTQLGTTTLAEPAVWTRVTALDNLAPSGGARVALSSDAAQFRFAVMPPRSAQNQTDPDNVPPNNGRLAQNINSVYHAVVPRGGQVWVKQA